MKLHLNYIMPFQKDPEVVTAQVNHREKAGNGFVELFDLYDLDSAMTDSFEDEVFKCVSAVVSVIGDDLQIIKTGRVRHFSFDGRLLLWWLTVEE